MAEQSDEDWFYDSISRYKNLNMFELDYPVEHLELIGNSDVCVSCSDGKRHQLLQLSLPTTLLSASAQQTTISNDNDLKIKCGTYCQSRVNHMKIVNGEIVIASFANSNCLATYKLSVDDSDDMKKLSMWKCELESPHLSIDDNHLILTKKRSSPSFVIDAKTGQEIGKMAAEGVGDSEDPVWPVILESGVVGLCYQSSGQVDFYDVRQLRKIGCIQRQPEKLQSWSFTSAYESSRTANGTLRLATLSNRGRLKIFESRNWHEPVLNENVGLSSTGPMSRARLKLKPEKNWVSVSGFDGNVYVLECKPEPEIVFRHEGHKHVEGLSAFAVTTGHVWLPGATGAVVSTADNGTVQSWRFEDRRTLGDS